MERSKAVCDAGPLIPLDELGCLSLLEDFDRVVVPAGVWEEVQNHRGDDFLFPVRTGSFAGSREAGMGGCFPFNGAPPR